MTIRQLAALLTIVLFTSPLTRAEEWREFRGPLGQGHSSAKNLPTQWSTTENVLWKSTIPGKGWSSPIVAGNGIFLTTAVAANDDENDQSLVAISISPDTGKPRWSVPLFQWAPGGGRVHPKNSHASATAIADDEHVFVHFGQSGTACLDQDTGDVVWKTTALEYEPQHGNGGSPVLVGDLLIVICDGADTNFIAALDRKTGDMKWKVQRTVDPPRRFSFSTPLLVPTESGPELVCPGTNLVTGHDPTSGKELWSVRYDGYSVIPRPIFDNGLVYICTGYGTPSLLAIRPGGRGDVTETHLKWSIKRSVPHTPSLLSINGDIYFVSDRGVMSCVDGETGDLHWRQRLDGAFSASPLFADNKIYLQGEQGEGIIVAPGREYKELARNQLEGRTFASYGVLGSTLLIRTEFNLYRIGKVPARSSDPESAPSAKP